MVLNFMTISYFCKSKNEFFTKIDGLSCDACRYRYCSQWYLYWRRLEDIRMGKIKEEN